MKKEEVIFMDVNELDDLITTHGQSIINYDENIHIKKKNYDINRLFIIKKGKNNLSNIEKLISVYDNHGWKNYITLTLLNDLCDRDIIEEGKYIIYRKNKGKIS